MRARLLVRHFLGEDITLLSMEEALNKVQEAEVVRGFEVDIFKEALEKFFE